MKTYILQFKYKEGNGWAIINAHSPNQAEQVFYTQTKFDTPSMISMQESNYYGEEMQLVYEGSVSTLNANLYSLAVLDGFEGSLDDFIQSQKGDKGDTGDTGPQGVGIAKVEQTTTSHESSGENVITVTLTNGNNYTFSVFNGEKGADGSGGGGTEQIQSDWAQSDNTKKDYIKNKPSLAAVATSGSYNDLSNKPTIPDAQVQANWNESDNTSKAYIQNKPTIPAAQVNADWNASSGVAQILNKPTIPTVPTNVSAFTNDAGYLNNSFCPIIEDTRSSAVATITGVAPFSSLVDGQRIIVHLKYGSAQNATLQLTLSGGTTTANIPLIGQISTGLTRVWANQVKAGQYISCLYDATTTQWLCIGIDTNTTYASIMQSDVNTAGTTQKLVTGKMLHDNAYIVEETYSSGSLKANKMYDFGTVSSALTIPSLDATNDLVSNALNFYALRFIAGADNLNITFPTGVVVDDTPTINTGDYVEIMINKYGNNFYASIKVWQAQ